MTSLADFTRHIHSTITNKVARDVILKVDINDNVDCRERGIEVSRSMLPHDHAYYLDPHNRYLKVLDSWLDIPVLETPECMDQSNEIYLAITLNKNAIHVPPGLQMFSEVRSMSYRKANSSAYKHIFETGAIMTLELKRTFRARLKGSREEIDKIYHHGAEFAYVYDYIDSLYNKRIFFAFYSYRDIKRFTLLTRKYLNPKEVSMKVNYNPSLLNVRDDASVDLIDIFKKP